ncbi:hypothetical protein TrVE_jg2862 [Triparma verrucosa]|uniref:Uncharacterized protein n=2 Tax=Triparma TaxID=722752 RepID=A0A9W7C0Z1_9STRA|nr:hypothetical protein TrVE_jg2862 [Triparma verrucosa]GMH97710.1 hypothetical protein TrST_g155 [Triparma strigata]
MFNAVLTSLGFASPPSPPPAIDLPFLQHQLTTNQQLLSELGTEITLAEQTLSSNDSLVSSLLSRRKALQPDSDSDSDADSGAVSPPPPTPSQSDLDSLDSTLRTLQISTEIQRYTLISLRSKRADLEGSIKTGMEHIREFVKEEGRREEEGEVMGVEGRELMERV